MLLLHLLLLLRWLLKLLLWPGLLLLRIGIGLLLGHRLLVPGVGPVAGLLGRRRVAVDRLCLMRGRCRLLVGPLAAIVSASVHLVGVLVVATRLLVDAT